MKKIIGLLAGFILCIGCEKEMPEQTEPKLPEGTFVVDYTAEAGVSTRALHENQPKGLRINSLTYLLYNEEGTLEKRREIPGLEGDDEIWPLTRENMSWEQREALKDTLRQGETYHAVFVANVNPDICGWTGADGASWSPLRDTETYESVYLQMPYQPFNDRNMFYLFTKEILSTDRDADREHPYNCSVLLQRAVTRADFMFEQLPLWKEEQQPDGGGTENPDGGTDGTEEGGGAEETPLLPLAETTYPATCTLPEDIKEYFISDFYQFVLNRYDDVLSRPVVDETVEFLNAVKGCFVSDGITDPNLIAKYARFYQRLNAIENEITGDGKTAFLGRINSDVPEGSNLSNFQTHILNTLLNELSDNTVIRNLFTESALRTKGKFASITYNGQSGVAKYYLSGKIPESNLDESLRIEADTTMYWDGVSYLGFNWLGLAEPEKNQVGKVSWYESADATTAFEELSPSFTLKIGQGENEKLTVLYRPIDELSLKEDWDSGLINDNKKETQIFCNLEKALPFKTVETGPDGQPMVNDNELIVTIKELLNAGKIKGYAGSLDNMPLTITYPDISKGEVLEIKYTWKVK